MGDNGEEEDRPTEPVHTITFSLGPPTDPDPNAEDSGLMDDNELTSSLLQPPATEDRMSASQLLAASAVQPHSSLRLVMRKIGNFLAGFTLITMLIVIPIVTYRQIARHNWDFAAFYSAEIMAFGTVVLSLRLIYLHFTHWYMPNVQKYVVRILWMVPLYAIQSWLGLRFRGARIYIDAVRDLYEAYVISSFLYYLIELLGGQEALVRTLRNRAREDPQTAEHLGDHGFLLNLVLEPWELGMEFMLQCKHGVLQYVVMKTVATVLTFIFQSMDVYGEGSFAWNTAYGYMAFFMNISVMYALYCLVKLFHAISDELRHPINWSPLGKFLCVKGVVFFTWWQGVIIYYLKAHGIIQAVGEWSDEEVANGLIDYCVCIEMIGFAIAHSFTFTYKEYLPATVEQAMSDYEQLRQQDTHDNEGGGSSNSTDGAQTRDSQYRPPETLARPMAMRDAFWSSTVPSETLHDIRRLKRGVDRVVTELNDPGTITLQEI